MTSRKQPGMAFWATVVVIGLVLYLLSFGPVEWLVRHGVGASWTEVPITWFYRPISWMYFNGPDPIHDALGWYNKLWQ